MSKENAPSRTFEMIQSGHAHLEPEGDRDIKNDPEAAVNAPLHCKMRRVTRNFSVLFGPLVIH